MKKRLNQFAVSSNLLQYLNLSYELNNKAFIIAAFIMPQLTYI